MDETIKYIKSLDKKVETLFDKREEDRHLIEKIDDINRKVDALFVKRDQDREDLVRLEERARLGIEAVERKICDSEEHTSKNLSRLWSYIIATSGISTIALITILVRLFAK